MSTAKLHERTARVQPFGEVLASQPERHNLVPIDRHRAGPAACS